MELAAYTADTRRMRAGARTAGVRTISPRRPASLMRELQSSTRAQWSRRRRRNGRSRPRSASLPQRTTAPPVRAAAEAVVMEAAAMASAAEAMASAAEAESGPRPGPETLLPWALAAARRLHEAATSRVVAPVSH